MAIWTTTSMQEFLDMKDYYARNCLLIGTSIQTADDGMVFTIEYSTGEPTRPGYQYEETCTVHYAKDDILDADTIE